MQVRLEVVAGKSSPRSIVLDAADLADARAQAVQQGLHVLSCRAVGTRRSWLGSMRGRTEQVDIAVLVEQMRDLLLAGLSLGEVLDALRRGSRGEAMHLTGALNQQLRGGMSLSDAMATHTVFPEVLVALVRASELTSDLPQALARFMDHHQRIRELRHRLVSTAIYPLLLLGVGALVLGFLMFYVMPRFARVFEGMTGDLPWSAQAMVWWATFLSEHGAWVAWSGAVAIALAIGATLNPGIRKRFPWEAIVGATVRMHVQSYFLSRWYRATGMLVQGGIPLPQALRMTTGLLPMHMRAGGAAVEQAVTDGHSPAAAHVLAGMATPIAEQLLLAGERTGDLGSVLTRVAQFHELEVSRYLERAMRILEPVVMVFIGLGVGLVVVLMYLPIFELASAIQ